jgi:hypothetical protein
MMNEWRVGVGVPEAGLGLATAMSISGEGSVVGSRTVEIETTVDFCTVRMRGPSNPHLLSILSPFLNVYQARGKSLRAHLRPTSRALQTAISIHRQVKNM